MEGTNPVSTTTKARGPLYSAIDLERALIVLFAEWKQATGPALALHRAGAFAFPLVYFPVRRVEAARGIP